MTDYTNGVDMLLGPCRIKISGASSSNEGLVLQAVLLMALVSTIGILIFAARVAGSRQLSASASASQAARQAAEYGYAEIMAEMNLDTKSYLWVTDSNNWNNVSAQDLKDCGVATSAAPIADPISALTSDQTLSRSTELSYRLERYEAPTNLANLASLPSSVPEVCKTEFGNLIGGSGVLTIVGTFNRGSGYTSTYTLKRNVSVNRAAPIFNNPITAPPPNRSVDAADSRFPIYPDAGNSTQVAYPGKPVGTYFDITCQPKGASTSVIECTAVPDSGSGSLSADFKSATASGSGNDDFPYLANGVDLWDPCQRVGANVRCLVKSMTVKTNANMLVATKRGTTDAPVEIFLSESMTIEPGAKLSGDDPANVRSWTRFRIFGVSSGTSCPNQTITIDSYNNSAPTPATVEPNLQNAFLWLSKGALKYQSSTALTSIPALVGSVCEFETADGRRLPASTAAAPAYLSTLSSGRFFEGLGGAYRFQGVFGGAAPIRFFYRGFGFNEQHLSS